MSIIETFRNIASEFDYLSDALVQKRLDLTAQEITNPEFPEANREQMISYLTAHYLTISEKRKGAGGEVTSISEGKLSIKYNDGYSVVKSDLAATGYGKIYDRMLRSFNITPLTRMVG